MADDNIQHGIDDNPSGDAEKGAALGGIGGAVTGLAAGAVAGPVGAVLGAIIGGVAGAAASGAAVAAVDRMDNDNTVTGLGGTTNDVNSNDSAYVNTSGHNVVHTTSDSGITGVNRLPGEEQGSLKTGGYANDGTPDTRGVGEKVVDGVTGDVVDDKTGKVVNHH
ncbi:MAG: hypothetical protein H7145_03690 [Akkermansiaceae bacterium]|nr:hypothetical protein [Armatimonadota bacterium]